MLAGVLGVDLTAAWRPRVGMVTLSLELTRALARSGVPLTLFCSGERPAGFEGVPAVLSPYRHELLNKLRWLPALEGQTGLDAVLYPYWPAPPVRRRAAPPALTFVHDLAYRLRPQEVPWQQRLYLGTLVPKALRQSAALLVPSQATRADLLGEYPLAGLADRVHVVGEGAPQLPPPGELPGHLEPGFLLAVGTVEPRKNYPRLLDAYALLRRRRGAAAPRLVIAGRTGWNVDGLVGRLRAEPGVLHLEGPSDATLAALYEGAAALAFPSLYEGFGLPLLEAMARGVPAVVARAGALPELAAGAAVEVDPLDPEAIAAGLQQVLDDPDLRARLAAAGRVRAAEFTWESVASRVGAVVATLGG
jgi:glycosyltransferase involved in cell wall biosynthesis